MEKKKLSQHVSELIFQNITAGTWKPGEKLPPEKELMEIYDVSRMTVREAISQLISSGVVYSRQGSGTYVREFDGTAFSNSMAIKPSKKNDILDVYRARKLEIIVAGEAAEVSTPEGVAELRKIHYQMVKNPSDSAVHISADPQFHLQICRMTNNPMLMGICKRIYDMIGDIMPTMSVIMGTSHGIELHGMLIDTIQKHYVEEAKHLMEKHILFSIDALNAIPEDSRVFSGIEAGMRIPG